MTRPSNMNWALPMTHRRMTYRRHSCWSAFEARGKWLLPSKAEPILSTSRKRLKAHSAPQPQASGRKSKTKFLVRTPCRRPRCRRPRCRRPRCRRPRCRRPRCHRPRCHRPRCRHPRECGRLRWENCSTPLRRPGSWDFTLILPKLASLG